MMIAVMPFQAVAAQVGNDGYPNGYYEIGPEEGHPDEAGADSPSWLVPDAYYSQKAHGPSIRLYASSGNLPPTNFRITVRAGLGGSATGGGTYQSGTSVTVNAAASRGYVFDGWFENGTSVSQSESYTFTVRSNRTLEARFTYSPSYFTVQTTAGTGGRSGGGGVFMPGDTATVYATPYNGYAFSGWYENGLLVSMNEWYSFSVYGDRTLEARFITAGINITVIAGTGGRARGTGTYKPGAAVTLRATANDGYVFDGWYEYGKRVSETEVWIIAADWDRIIEARFSVSEKPPEKPPEEPPKEPSSSSFDPSSDGFSFANTWNSFGYPNGYRIPMERYIEVFGPVDGPGRYGDVWGGSCFGFSSTSGLFYTGRLAASSYGASTVNRIPAPGSPNSETTKLLERFQISQRLYGIQRQYSFNIPNLIDAVTAFKNTGQNPVMVLMWGYGSGHAVIGYDVKQDASGYTVMLYDNNFPNQSRTLNISSDMKSWRSDDYAQYGYSSAAGGDLGFVSTNVVGDNMQNHLDGNMQYLTVNTRDADIYNSNGVPVDDIPGAMEVRIYDNQMHTDMAYYVPQGKYYIKPADGGAISTGNPIEIGISDSENYISIEIENSAAEVVVELGDTPSVELNNVSGEIDIQLRTASKRYSDRSASARRGSGRNSYKIEFLPEEAPLPGVSDVVIDESSTVPDEYGAVDVSMSFSTNEQEGDLGLGMSSWAAGTVNEAVRNKFVPISLRSRYQQAITRAEFCALVVALYESYTGEEITGRVEFDDTDDINVQKAAAVGLVTGAAGNSFDPDRKLTREQAATLLSRFTTIVGNPFPVHETTFSDKDSIASYALDAVGQMQAAGLISGYSDNTFHPKDEYTREQGIITIMRLLENLE